MSAHSSKAAGWYIDTLTGGRQFRYYDGTAWTDQIAPLPTNGTLPGSGPMFGGLRGLFRRHSR
ncbi:MAG: DUF2510 domain-containing protein [Actinomycetales bacterium]